MFSNAQARQPFLCALANVARGAHVNNTVLCRDGAPQRTIAAVLADPPQRLAVFGARDGLELSLASVYACFVALFLGGFRGIVQRRFAVAVPFQCCATAASRDGTTLYATAGTQHLLRISLATGKVLREVTADTEAQGHVSVAIDGLVYVADTGRHRVQVLTPDLDFLAYIGEGKLHQPWAISTTAEVVVVSSAVDRWQDIQFAVLFRRSDGVELRRVALDSAYVPSLCFWQDNIAVGDLYTRFVKMINQEGRAGFTAMYGPVQNIACSDAGELVLIGGGVCVLDTQYKVVNQVFCGNFCERFPGDSASRGCVRRDNVISVTAAPNSWTVTVWA
jgi:hypothetical protein